MSTIQTKRLDKSNHNKVLMAIDNKINTPPMVGVPLLAMCVSMPYPRIGWPILRAVNLRITAGPAMRPMSNEVKAAITARKVMY